MGDDLKPCPFCGGEAERLDLTDEANLGGSVICCKRCGASSPVHFDRKENLYDDSEPQMSRILACVGFAAPAAGDER